MQVQQRVYVSIGVNKLGMQSQIRVYIIYDSIHVITLPEVLKSNEYPWMIFKKAQG